MQIALGRRGDYSVRAMLVLARAFGDGRRKARQIAKTMDIPAPYVPQIMAPLVRGHFVLATAGPDGGYELACPPDSITLLEVIEAAEGPLAREQCLLQGGPCDWEQVCPVHDVWARAHDALGNELRAATFKELAENDRLIERGKFHLPELPAHPVAVERAGERER